MISSKTLIHCRWGILWHLLIASFEKSYSLCKTLLLFSEEILYFWWDILMSVTEVFISSRRLDIACVREKLVSLERGGIHPTTLFCWFLYFLFNYRSLWFWNWVKLIKGCLLSWSFSNFKNNSIFISRRRRNIWFQRWNNQLIWSWFILSVGNTSLSNYDIWLDPWNFSERFWLRSFRHKINFS